jgi:hypothetical protein
VCQKCVELGRWQSRVAGHAGLKWMAQIEDHRLLLPTTKTSPSTTIQSAENADLIPCDVGHSDRVTSTLV